MSREELPHQRVRRRLSGRLGTDPAACISRPPFRRLSHRETAGDLRVDEPIERLASVVLHRVIPGPDTPAARCHAAHRVKTPAGRVQGPRNPLDVHEAPAPRWSSGPIAMGHREGIRTPTASRVFSARWHGAGGTKRTVVGEDRRPIVLSADGSLHALTGLSCRPTASFNIQQKRNVIISQWVRERARGSDGASGVPYRELSNVSGEGCRLSRTSITIRMETE